MGRAIRVDAAIAGGGIIGLSLGLELLRRGLTVAVVERGRAMGGASWAAAGMLAVHDPRSPPQLLPLASLSRQLYPEYLAQVESLSGIRVPLRTHTTLQYEEAETGTAAVESGLAGLAPGLHLNGQAYAWLDEASLDPRDLCEALPSAFRRAGGTMLEDAGMLSVASGTDGVLIATTRVDVSAGMFVNCCGAWAAELVGQSVPVFPVKGQLINLRCAPERLRCVVRSRGIYLVPRGDGRVLAGATVERAGFDTVVLPSAIAELTQAALQLLPELSVPQPVDAWAGLRPGTPDDLPILGEAAQLHCWHATGHYRDGILLAPATARVVAQIMVGEPAEVSLQPFSAKRFEATASAQVLKAV